MGRKVAIVAKGGTSALAPWQDEEWEIWGMPWISYPRVDVLFEPHEHDAYADNEFVDRWKSILMPQYEGLPIYCPKSRVDEFENGRELPIKEIKRACKFTYLENTICYQLGFAMLQDDIDEISLFGIHMRGPSEYEHERAFVMYAIGVLEGKGMKVNIVDGSPLFMSLWEAGRYGVNQKRRDFSMWGGAGAAVHIPVKE